MTAVDRAFGQEQDTAYYDDAFSGNDEWRCHYTSSPYYFLWTVIIDRLRRLERPKTIEIACGPGQLASALHDAGVVSGYLGFDFSEVAIAYARSRCPDLEFRVEDALKTRLLDDWSYSAAISTEFLEHVENDLGVLSRLRQGTLFLGTVPNFPYVSHVRCFESCEHVRNRYEYLFSDLNVTSIPGNETDKVFFLMEGIRS